MTEQEKQIQTLSAKLTDTMCMLKSLIHHYSEHIAATAGVSKETAIQQINSVAGQLRTEAILQTPGESENFS